MSLSGVIQDSIIPELRRIWVMFISALNWLNVAIKTANFFPRHSLAEFTIFPADWIFPINFSTKLTNEKRTYFCNCRCSSRLRIVGLTTSPLIRFPVDTSASEDRQVWNFWKDAVLLYKRCDYFQLSNWIGESKNSAYSKATFSDISMNSVSFPFYHQRC